MGEFLSQVRQTHPADLLVIALDGARSHKAQDLTVPAHIRVPALPADAPELRRQEPVWEELREKSSPPLSSNAPSTSSKYRSNRPACSQ